MVPHLLSGLTRNHAELQTNGVGWSHQAVLRPPAAHPAHMETHADSFMPDVSSVSSSPNCRSLTLARPSRVKAGRHQSSVAPNKLAHPVIWRHGLGACQKASPPHGGFLSSHLFNPLPRLHLTHLLLPPHPSHMRPLQEATRISSSSEGQKGSLGAACTGTWWVPCSVGGERTHPPAARPCRRRLHDGSWSRDGPKVGNLRISITWTTCP